MADYDSDQAKELRRARLLKIKPKAAPLMLPEADFKREYVEYRYVSREHVPDLEEYNQVMFCPACAKDLNPAMAKYRVLHISYEDDALGNYPLIAVAKCHGCDWEEMIPVVKAEITSDDRILLRRYRTAQGKLGSFTTAAPPPPPGLHSPNAISKATLDTLKVNPVFNVTKGIDTLRFGQGKADSVWKETAKNQQDAIDLEIARRSIDVIEEMEEKDRQHQMNKMAQMGAMYGSAQALQNQLGQQMARKMDAEIMRQMMNSYGLPQTILKDYSLTSEEVEAIKKEPAAAAKAAHQTLIEKVKQAFGK